MEVGWTGAERPQLHLMGWWVVPGPLWALAPWVFLFAVAITVGLLGLAGVLAMVWMPLGVVPFGVLPMVWGVCALCAVGLPLCGLTRVKGLADAEEVVVVAAKGRERWLQVLVEGAPSGWVYVFARRREWVPKGLVPWLQARASGAAVRVRTPAQRIPETQWNALVATDTNAVEPRHAWSHDGLAVTIAPYCDVRVDGGIVHGDFRIPLHRIGGIRVVDAARPALWIWDSALRCPRRLVWPAEPTRHTQSHLVWFAQQLRTLCSNVGGDDRGDASDVPEALRELADRG